MNVEIKDNKMFFVIRLCSIFFLGNECEKHWRYFKESAYKFCDIPTTKWIDAQKVCQDMGADLIKVSTEKENEFIHKIQKSLEFQSSWLGLRRGADNKFSWPDGSSLNYTKWRPGEPTQDDRISKDCAELIGGHWRSVHCHRTNEVPQFVCEKSMYIIKAALNVPRELIKFRSFRREACA